MNISSRQNELVELFALMDDWQQRFQYLIEIGANLPTMRDELKIPVNRIKTCISRTYFHISILNGKLHLRGWSNASIPSGMIMMLKIIFDGATIDEVLNTEIDFPIKTGLQYKLSAQRLDTLYEMINRIRKFAEQQYDRI